jgi:hypothetical protein
MSSLRSKLKKLTSKYQDQFTELESCFTEDSHLITLTAHYVMLASFLEALFYEIIGWLVLAYKHPTDCSAFSVRIEPILHWEYGQNFTNESDWEERFKGNFEPSKKDQITVLRKLSFIFQTLQFVELIKPIFEDLIDKRNKIAHGDIYKESLKNPSLRRQYNDEDLKEQSQRVKDIMTNLFESCNDLLNSRT